MLKPLNYTERAANYNFKGRWLEIHIPHYVNIMYDSGGFKLLETLRDIIITWKMH